MPELPEVETLCRQLNTVLLGKTILGVEVLDRRLAPPGGLIGRAVRAVTRQGKYLRIALDGLHPDRRGVDASQANFRKEVGTARSGRAGMESPHAGLDLVLHLRMTGRLLWQPLIEPPAHTACQSPPEFQAQTCPKLSARTKADTRSVERHGRATRAQLPAQIEAPLPLYARLVLLFANGRLVLADPRRFATIGQSPLHPAHAPPAGILNPLEGLPAGRLRKLAGSRRLPVKSLLMDQRLIAGIGNIYACEILFAAGIDPQRPAGSLETAEWRRIQQAAAVVLPRAVECRGTSISDWRDLFGAPGTNQHHLEVYARQGKPCRRCSTPIERLTLAGRGTWLCPSCQK
jgi:formamidopyrimidine-DNA glycosylase